MRPVSVSNIVNDFKNASALHETKHDDAHYAFRRRGNSRQVLGRVRIRVASGGAIRLRDRLQGGGGM